MTANMSKPQYSLTREHHFLQVGQECSMLLELNILNFQSEKGERIEWFQKDSLIDVLKALHGAVISKLHSSVIQLASAGKNKTGTSERFEFATGNEVRMAYTFRENQIIDTILIKDNNSTASTKVDEKGVKGGKAGDGYAYLPLFPEKLIATVCPVEITSLNELVQVTPARDVPGVSQYFCTLSKNVTHSAARKRKRLRQIVRKMDKSKSVKRQKLLKENDISKQNSMLRFVTGDVLTKDARSNSSSDSCSSAIKLPKTEDKAAFQLSKDSPALGGHLLSSEESSKLTDRKLDNGSLSPELKRDVLSFENKNDSRTVRSIKSTEDKDNFSITFRCDTSSQERSRCSGETTIADHRSKAPPASAVMQKLLDSVPCSNDTADMVQCHNTIVNSIDCHRRDEGKMETEEANNVIMLDEYGEVDLNCVSCIEQLSATDIKHIIRGLERKIRDIFEGKVHRQRHEDYKNGGVARSNLQYQIYAGSFSEEQQDSVMETLIEMFCYKHSRYLDYVMKVLFPESLKFLVSFVQKVTMEQAEELLSTTRRESKAF